MGREWREEHRGLIEDEAEFSLEAIRKRKEQRAARDVDALLDFGRTRSDVNKRFGAHGFDEMVKAYNPDLYEKSQSDDTLKAVLKALETGRVPEDIDRRIAEKIGEVLRENPPVTVQQDADHPVRVVQAKRGASRGGRATCSGAEGDMAANRFKFRFEDLDLDGTLVSWNDAIAIRIARHSYLKRDGAEQEPMGAEAGRFSMKLSFVGASFATQYRALVTSIRQDPRGLLVHPLLGQIRVACSGIADAACEPGRAKNVIDLTLTFEEDALDTAVAAESVDSPLAAASRVATASARFKAASARFPATASTAAALLSKASTYSAAAQAVVAGAADSSLASRLGAVGVATDAAVVALLGDPLAQRASAFVAVSSAVAMYAACVQFDRAVAASRPPIVEYRVAGPTNLFVLAARLYGAAQARARAQEILAINRVPDPAFIPLGFLLRIARPTAP